LKDFARVVSHDLKSLAAQIASLMDLLKMSHLENPLTKEALVYVDYSISVSRNMTNLIDGILNYNMNFDSTEMIRLEDILNLVRSNLNLTIRKSNAVIKYKNFAKKYIC